MNKMRYEKKSGDEQTRYGNGANSHIHMALDKN